jgi:hypothetical protein
MQSLDLPENKRPKRSGYFYKMLDFTAVGLALILTRSKLVGFVAAHIQYQQAELQRLSNLIDQIGWASIVTGGVNLVPAFYEKSRNCYFDFLNAAAFGFIGWEIWKVGENIIRSINPEPDPAWQRFYTYLGWGDYIVGGMILFNLARVGIRFFASNVGSDGQDGGGRDDIACAGQGGQSKKVTPGRK